MPDEIYAERKAVEVPKISPFLPEELFFQALESFRIRERACSSDLADSDAIPTRRDVRLISRLLRNRFSSQQRFFNAPARDTGESAKVKLYGKRERQCYAYARRKRWNSSQQ